MGATLVPVLAYAGLRPGEALGLTWGHVRERTILVERAVSLGGIKDTKTRRIRSVRLLASAVIRPRRVASGLRPARRRTRLVFPNHAGGCGRATTGGLVRRFCPARRGRRRARRPPYTFAIASARCCSTRAGPCRGGPQAGHAPSMSLDTYQHVMDELKGVEPAPAGVDPPRPAPERQPDVPVWYPPGAGRVDHDPRSALGRKADERIRTADPFITSEVLYQLSYVGPRPAPGPRAAKSSAPGAGRTAPRTAGGRGRPAGPARGRGGRPRCARGGPRRPGRRSG